MTCINIGNGTIRIIHQHPKKSDKPLSAGKLANQGIGFGDKFGGFEEIELIERAKDSL